jgi:hypothetical protein
MLDTFVLHEIELRKHLHKFRQQEILKQNTKKWIGFDRSLYLV